jgi:membrane protease subunit HflK
VPPVAAAGAAPAPNADDTLIAWLGGPASSVLVATAVVAGVMALFIGLPHSAAERSVRLTAGISVACLLAAGVAALVARYLAVADSKQLPEGLGLARGARLVSGVLVLAAGSPWLSWAGRSQLETLLFFVAFALNASLIGALISGCWADRQPADARTLPLDYLVLELLGSRANPLASLVDAAERRLGVDLRSTWALLVVRRSLEPLVFALVAMGWLATSLTRVGPDEQALVEHFGVRVGEPLGPGLHLDWPWPVTQVIREPVRRVRGITVGHEGEERGGGPENVLWAVQHAKNEFVLVLGDGRDLITVDGDVQYRIKDMAAWKYHWRDPQKMLTALAYRAVMRATVDKTLSEALSQNISRLTAQMKTQVQADADTLELGVEVVAFTMGGMHPPVPVSAAYQGVVSAELGRVTASVAAQSYRNELLPAARAAAEKSIAAAKAEAAETEARATGEGWSFRTLETQYRVSPEEYKFRRRLETLESVLGSRALTIIDRRIERDGGQLWLKE